MSNAPCRSGTPFWGREVGWQQLGHSTTCPSGVWHVSGLDTLRRRHGSSGAAWGLCSALDILDNCSFSFSRVRLAEKGHSAIGH